VSPFVLIVIIAVVLAFVRGAGRSRRTQGRGGALIPLVLFGFILANIFSRSAQSVSIDPIALIWLGLAVLPIILVVALLVRIARRRDTSSADTLPTPAPRPPATRRPPAQPPVLRSEPTQTRQPDPTPRSQVPPRRSAPSQPMADSSPVVRSTPPANAPTRKPVTGSSTAMPASRPRPTRSTTRSTSSLTRRKTASDELVERARKSLEAHRPTRRPRDDKR
jgi:outer membrane biosynthesis protein TonB